MTELSLGIAENNQTISVSVGDLIQIVLHQNAASSGFEWGVVSFSADALAFESRMIREGGGGEIGSGQQDVVFRFQVNQEGAGFVELGLSRGNPKVSSNFKFRVGLDISA